MDIFLIVVLLSLAGLGAYLGRHGLADGRWGSYAVIYGVVLAA